MYAIDNSLTFDTFVELYKYFGGYGGKTAPKEIQERMKVAFELMKDKMAIKKLLAGLLAPEEIEACLNRAEKISRYITEFGTLPGENNLDPNYPYSYL